MSALYFKNTVRRAGAKRRGLKSSLLVVVVSECGHKSEDTLNTRKKKLHLKNHLLSLKIATGVKKENLIRVFESVKKVSLFLNCAGGQRDDTVFYLDLIYEKLD